MSSLDDLRILELSGHVAAGLCGKLMAGFGARLLRIPAAAGLAGFELDADEHAWFHGDKRERALDLRRAEDAAVFETELHHADVLIDGWGFDVLAVAGYDRARLRALNPRLIVVQISPFGQTGPHRAHRASDLTLYARAGLMQSTGSPHREPLNARPRIAEISAGLHACCAALTAVMQRHHSGCGTAIDVSIHEAAMENYEIALIEFTVTGKLARRNGDDHAMVPWRTYRCADGEAAIIGGPVRHWLRAAPLFDAPELLDESKLARMDQRIAHRGETERLLQPWLLAHDKRSIFHTGQQRGLAWAYLATMPEALADPQHAARGFFISAPRADGVMATMPGAPFDLPRSPWCAPQAANDAAPQQADSKAAATAGPEAAVPCASAAPFAGLRVLDFTHDWAGPHAARFFADYGAEVIKIEYPRRLDGMRGGLPERVNDHPRFWQLHRGKKSVTLDLALPGHREVLDEMVRGADLVIENSRPGVMDTKGYGHARLCQLRPDLITLSMSAFGDSGPYAQYCGYGGTLEAISGLQSLTAYDAQSPAYRVREMDVLNGVMGICAALLALRHRQRFGEGQRVDLSECETTAWLAGERFAAVARDGRQPAALGNRHPLYAPQGCYPALGQDRWLVLSARSDDEWRALARAIGGDMLASDPRYADAAARRQRHDELDARISAWSTACDAVASAEALQAAGVAAAWVANCADLDADPHLADRRWWLDVDGLRLPGLPFAIAGWTPQILERGPALGAHNKAFFAAVEGAGEEPCLLPGSLGTAYSLS